MKTKLFNIAIIIAIIASVTSCDIANDNVLNYDGETAVSAKVPSVQCTNFIVAKATSATGNVSYTADVPMNVYSASGCITVTNTDGSFTYTLQDITPVEKEINGEKKDVTLTRDLTVYLAPATRTKYRDYGYYTYPVRIRQYGSHTQYISADEITSFNDKLDFNDQKYLLGKVVSVGSIETDSYPIVKYSVNPQYFYDRGAMPSLSDEQCPTNLSEKFVTITLDVDGKNIKILVNDLARDSFMESFTANLKTGTVVEVSLEHARYDANFGGLIDINPFAFM